MHHGQLPWSDTPEYDVTRPAAVDSNQVGIDRTLDTPSTVGVGHDQRHPVGEEEVPTLGIALEKFGDNNEAGRNGDDVQLHDAEERRSQDEEDRELAGSIKNIEDIKLEDRKTKKGSNIVCFIFRLLTIMFFVQ